jgi:glycosyltransferase involved in cell wall biosynthesis
MRLERRPRALAAAVARALHLPAERPDCVLVHDLTTLYAFRGVRSAYPGVPIVLWYHGGEIPGSSVLREPVVREALRSVTLGIGNTNYAASALAARGVPRERIRVMPIGVSAAGFDPPSPKRYRPNGILRLLFVGRLSPEKGVDDLLEALALLRTKGERRVRLRVAGTGPAGEQFRMLSRRLGLEDEVEFLGYRDRQALARELAESDALVLPSRTIGNFSENQGVVMQEAMLMRLPVVSTVSGGIQESISPQNRSLSVPEHDAAKLAASIESLLEAPEARLAELGDDGRRFVLQRYDPQTQAASLMKALREAMTAAPDVSTIR